MLQFIKGQGIASYNELISLNSSYNDALYLDTDANRLYLAGNPVDVRIKVISEINDDLIPRVSYEFTNAAGQVTVVKDTVIPSIDEVYKTVLHDMESGADTDYKNGLYSVRDKYLLEVMAKLIGVTVKYTYYANVHHIEERKNNDFETTRDVIVYQNEDGDWLYDYESFEYTIYRKEGEQYVPDDSLTQPAGSETVDAELVRVQSMEIIRKGDVPVFFDGGELEATKETLKKHGGLAAGTKVEDLEKETISEVLSTILFETAKPEKVCDVSAKIKFADTYTSTGYVEVGGTYPSADDLEVVFVSETWQNKLDGEEIGETQTICEVGEIKKYIKDDQHPWTGGHGEAPDNIYDMEAPGYADHYQEYKVVEGDKSVYFATVAYTVTENPKDSDGKESYMDGEDEVFYRVDEGEEGFVAVGDSATIETENRLHLDGNVPTGSLDVEFNIIAAWKVASNAALITDKTIWNERYDDPEEFAGNDDKTVSDFFAYDGAVLYAKWYSEYTPEDKFYIYLPTNFTISSIGGAHDALPDNWSAESSVTKSDEVVMIENTNTVSREYNKYEVQKALGVTNVKFTIAKV